MWRHEGAHHTFCSAGKTLPGILFWLPQFGLAADHFLFSLFSGRPFSRIKRGLSGRVKRQGGGWQATVLPQVRRHSQQGTEEAAWAGRVDLRSRPLRAAQVCVTAPSRSPQRDVGAAEVNKCMWEPFGRHDFCSWWTMMFECLTWKYLRKSNPKTLWDNSCLCEFSSMKGYRGLGCEGDW